MTLFATLTAALGFPDYWPQVFAAGWAAFGLLLWRLAE